MTPLPSNVRLARCQAAADEHDCVVIPSEYADALMGWLRNATKGELREPPGGAAFAARCVIVPRYRAVTGSRLLIEASGVRHNTLTLGHCWGVIRRLMLDIAEGLGR